MKHGALFVIVAFGIVACSTFGMTIIAEDIGGGQLQIGYQLAPGELPLGFALQVEISGGAYVSDAFGSPYFPVYMDSAFSQGAGYVIGSGTPFTQIGAPGELHLPASSFSICMAAPLSFEAGMGITGDLNGDAVIDIQDLAMMSSEWLYGGPAMTNLDGCAPVNLLDYVMMAEPAWTGSLDNLITLQLEDDGEGFANVTITADTLRGGIAGNDGRINFDPVQTTVLIPEPATLSLLVFGGLTLFRKRK